MKYRDVELYYQLTLDDVGTRPLDLKTTDPVSAIRLDFEAKNGGTSNKSNFISDIITKIELTDGSDQLLSINMKEGQAAQFYKTKKMPYIRPEEHADGQNNEQVVIFFGREMWDKEYYMDLTKFSNPQLKISTNIAAIRAAGADAYLAGGIKVTITLHVIEEGALPAKGFFMQKEIYSFTSGTSGDEHISLPVDYPYASLLLRSYIAGNDIDENISNLRLSCDAGKFVPIDKKVKKIYQMNEEDIGPGEVRYYLFRKDNEVVYHVLNHDPQVSVMPRDGANICNVYFSWSGNFTLRVYDSGGSAVTSEKMLSFIAKGGAPHSTVWHAFGLLEDPETYFDPKEWNDLDLVLAQSAAAVCQVVLTQLRPFE